MALRSIPRREGQYELALAEAHKKSRTAQKISEFLACRRGWCSCTSWAT